MGKLYLKKEYNWREAENIFGRAAYLSPAVHERKIKHTGNCESPHTLRFLGRDITDHILHGKGLQESRVSLLSPDDIDALIVAYENTKKSVVEVSLNLPIPISALPKHTELYLTLTKLAMRYGISHEGERWKDFRKYVAGIINENTFPVDYFMQPNTLRIYPPQGSAFDNAMRDRFSSAAGKPPSRPKNEDNYRRDQLIRALGIPKKKLSVALNIIRNKGVLVDINHLPDTPRKYTYVISDEDLERAKKIISGNTFFQQSI